jgi:hypothetical protein
MRRNFFVWKKILVRSVHLFIVLFVTGSLLIKNETGNIKILLKNFFSFINYLDKLNLRFESSIKN